MSFQSGKPTGQYGNAPPSYSQPTGYPSSATGPGNPQQPIPPQSVAGQGQFDQEGWMAPPKEVPAGISVGLQYLMTVDKLLIKQKVELFEAITGWETNNKYTIKNGRGEKVFYAVEDTDCCTRMCCGPIRPFDMKILDIYQNEVIHLRRELACDSCCFPCCLQKIEVYLHDGKLAGTVEQTWSFCTPKFDIKDANGVTILKVKGPICTLKCCSDVNFKVLSVDKSVEVGKISKQWSGISRELFTDADFFGISFPVDLDVRVKAVLIGACFLIDFMYFEHSG